MRLIVVVEGQTEEAFVKEVLKPHLDDREVYTSATIVGKIIAQKRGKQGRGGGHFRHWKKDIDHILQSDANDALRVTTLFDLYGLPDDFPGLHAHANDADTNRRCIALENALAATFNDTRLIPYLQRHEFEALVLASLPSLRDLLDAEDDLAGLSVLETLVSTTQPEEINDGATTAPSKRLIAHLPGFRKTLHGPLAAMGTGLVSLRQQCPRFDGWVSILETLGRV